MRNPFGLQIAFGGAGLILAGLMPPHWLPLDAVLIVIGVAAMAFGLNARRT